MSGSRAQVAMLALMCSMAIPDVCLAQAVTASEREALVRLSVDRGGRAEDVDALIRVANDAGGKGLPVAPIASKIREGLSKGAAPARIDSVIRQLAAHLESADQLIRDVQPGTNPSERELSVTLMAEALASGLSRDDVSELRTQAQGIGRPAVSTETLASAAKGLSFIKEAKLPTADGVAVMAEAARQGYRTFEMLDLGREIKHREREYREGRASLLALRESIARGSRPDQLFRDTRTGPVERPAATRPQPTATRPETPARPERPQPVERPSRPERPESPTAGRTR